VGDEAVASRLNAEVLPHLLRAYDIRHGGTRQADGFRACLIWLFAADTDRAHD
jgi:N-acetylglucosamine kinase-like BadF-type ATPase